MTTVNNIEDLARILETRPHWAATLRTLLLSAELLALPQTVADLAAGMRELQAGQKRLDERLERLVSAQEQLSERFERLANAQEQLGERFERLANAQEQLSERFERLVNTQEQLGERFELLVNTQEQLGERFERLAEEQGRLAATQSDLVDAVRELQAGQERLSASQSDLADTVRELQAGQERLSASHEKLNAAQERLSASLERLNEAQLEMARDIRQLQEGYARLEVRQDRLEVRQDHMEVRQDRMEARQDRMETLLGHLVGSDLEARLHRRIRPLVSQRLRLRQTTIKQSNLLEPDDVFFNEVATAFNDGVITAEQEQRISDTDFIMRARRPGSNDTVWVAAEVANRLDQSDITRASDSAAALAAIYDAEVVPVVIGYRIDEIDDVRATAAGVLVIIMQPAYLP